MNVLEDFAQYFNSSYLVSVVHYTNTTVLLREINYNKSHNAPKLSICVSTSCFCAYNIHSAAATDFKVVNGKSPSDVYCNRGRKFE